MERKTYCVTMQAGTTVAEIRDEKGSATYDFEIEATDVEVGMMRDLFNNCIHGDFMMWMHGHTLWSDMPDRDNDEYDDNLREIYRLAKKRAKRREQHEKVDKQHGSSRNRSGTGIAWSCAGRGNNSRNDRDDDSQSNSAQPRRS
ncbi:hypothetical protein [Brevibacillus parabrevis]|uniref:hypothetical protein n=1 Tax=Brevibacillus parabrevis TaxID=54914 RepID=UPI002E1EB229|nr:hypothetical protein [Brevibacillus parabrevis]